MLLLWLLAASASADPCDLLLHAPSLELAQASIDQTVFQDPLQCVLRLVDNGDWETAELLSSKTIVDDSKLVAEAKKRAMDYKRQIEKFLRALGGDPAQKFAGAPALQWAQSPDKVFLEVQWAHRFDSPGCLDIKNRNVVISPSSLEISGECAQGSNLEKYAISIEFPHEVDPDASTQSFVAKGRGVITLKKRDRGVWESPVKGLQPPQLKVWTDMRDRYAKEMAKFTEESS